MFDYLSAPTLPAYAESTVVFGRNDAKVAQAAGELILANLAETIVISGGVGKDTGNLLERGYRSEAHFLESEIRTQAQAAGYAHRIPEMFIDEAATNGAENARNSLALLHNNNRSIVSLTAVAHATSARRLAEGLKHEAKLQGVNSQVYVQPSAYPFNPDNPVDQQEARAELLRLADWPEKNWLGPQTDLPEDLVDFARDQQPKS